MYRRLKKIPKSNCAIQTDSGELTYTLARSSRRRTIAIYVDDKAEVSVYSPTHVPDLEIRKFIIEKTNWIFEKVLEAQRKKSDLEKRGLKDGNEFFFLGKKFVLKVQKKDIKRPKVNFDTNGWTVEVPANSTESQIKNILHLKMEDWYKEQAKEVIGGRLFHFSRLLGVGPKEIAVKTQKRLWGNCDYNLGKININWHMVVFPIDIIDYVAVHELCHLIVPNHSKRFWNKVEKIMPDYKMRKKWLKTHSNDMVLPL